VEEQTILVLIQVVELNGTLQPTHDSRKSDGADGAIIAAASQCQGLLVLLVIVLLLGRLLLSCLLLCRLILGSLLPQKMDKPCIEGFIVCGIPMSLVSQFFNSHIQHVNPNIYELLYLVIKMGIIKNRSMT
jgi:hypothetical protein